MGWGGLDAPAPYAGTRWGAGWSPLLLLNLPASEDSSCTIQIKQMTKGTRVGMGPRSRVAFSGKLMSTGDHNKSNFENAQPLLSTLFKLWGVCVGVGGGRNGVGGVVVVVVVGQQLSVTVSRHPAIVQLQLWHPQALSSLSLIVRKCVKYALIVYSCVRGTKHFYVTVDIESVKIAEIILILDFVCSFRCLPQTYSTSWSTSRVFFLLIFWNSILCSCFCFLVWHWIVSGPHPGGAEQVAINWRWNLGKNHRLGEEQVEIMIMMMPMIGFVMFFSRRVAKAYARAPVLTVNGSDDGFDGFRWDLINNRTLRWRLWWNSLFNG